MNSISDIFTESKLVLDQGGPVLWAMVLLSIVMYGLIVSTWFGLVQVKKEIGELDGNKLDSSNERSLECEVAIFEMSQFAWVKRRLPMIAVLVAAAPLAGLLGTVFGMFITFSGMGSQAAANPIDNISVGISTAMITTQAGLFMAIPGAILLAMLRSQMNTIQGTLEQKMYRQMATMKGGLE